MASEKLIQKADIALSDLSANGGLLSPEQSEEFIRRLIKQPTIVNQARVVPMKGSQRKINKIGFGSRILRKPAASLTDLPAADRSKPTTSQIVLNTNELQAEVWIPYDVIEDNIEGGNIGTHKEKGAPNASGGIVDTIMDMITEQVGADLEEYALLADTISVDPMLALDDGWIKRCNAHTFDQTNNPCDRTMFHHGLKIMPPQYIRSRRSLKHFVSVGAELDYREFLGGRETALGDAQHAQGINPVYGVGSLVEPSGYMPSTTGILTNPKNFIMGIQRNIHIETDKKISARAVQVVVTLRIALQVEEPDAAVLYQNIGSL